MYAALKATSFLAIPRSNGTSGKQYFSATGAPPATNRRRTIDPAATLQACDAKFSNGDIYKSATEICTLNLVPPGESPASMASFWQANTLTGDNLREEPCVDLYPRLTTKSNTCTVHMCVQSLRKATATASSVFVNPAATAAGARDVVLSEYRDGTTIERYIDPSDPALPDFVQQTVSNPSSSALNIDQYYKFRVVGTRQFAP